jgi:hypothetical protein
MTISDCTAIMAPIGVGMALALGLAAVGIALSVEVETRQTVWSQLLAGARRVSCCFRIRGHENL